MSDDLAIGVNALDQFAMSDLNTGTPTGVTFPTPYKYPPGGFAVSPDGKQVGGTGH